jgi:tetratricopeptide (TPR) repeat protein
MVRAAVAIFAIALVVRLVHVCQLRGSPVFSVLMGDAHGYDEWARRIAGGDWFGHEVFYQAPLYPYLLGVIYAIFGHSLMVVRVIQAIIGSASCALLGLAAARLFSRRVGIAAGVMLALYAPAIFFDGLIQKSVLDVFFVCLALWLISRALTAERAEHAEKEPLSLRPPRSPRLQAWFCLGLAMGGLSLTRENALVFVAVIVVWALTGFDRPRTDAPRLKRAAMFLAGLALVLVPVAARNSLVGGGFYVTTSQFGPNFYIGNNPLSDGTYQSLRFGRGAPEYERQDATEIAEHARGRRLTPAEVSSYWTDQALDFVTSRPAAWLKLLGKKVLLLWNASEMLDTESQETHAEWTLPLRLGAPFGHFGVLVPLALFGVIVTWPRRSRLRVVYAMAVAYAASVVLFYVFARYRYPLVPFLMLFAAAGLMAVPDAIRARALPGGVRSLAAVAAVAVFANWPVLSAATMRAVTESNLGVAFQSEGRLEEAIAHYQRSIALRSDYAPVYSNMASALRAQGRLQDAVATYERALRLQPDFPDAQYNLANALLDEGNADAAIEHFQVALRSIAGSAEVHSNLGIAFAAKGNTDEAIKQFRAALEIDPGAAKAHRNLGDVLALTGRTDEAIDHLRRAAQLNPEDPDAHYNLGGLFLDMHRLDEAVAEFRAALTLTPGSVEAHNNLGIALASQGKLEEAIDQFRQALRIQPGFEDAQRNLAMALQARKKG